MRASSRLLCVAGLLLLCHPALGSFDWGDGCEGGNGTFALNLTSAGQLATVGTLPAGKWNVKVFLSASADLDVQIYDQEEKDKFAEGKAIVAWCENPKTCNIGALGSDERSGSVTYKGMRVTYSGYGGVDGKPGNEYITLEGKVSTSLVMKAFAFQPGEAIVSYEWGRVQTGCCLGISPCSGSFELNVPKGTVANVGDIPIGKKNLEVRLNAEEDVDIQLYDTMDTSEFSEGKAIIAYCDTHACNKGALGNNDGSAESTKYKGITYLYSGYDGSSGEKGNEYVRVKGVSNTKLSMKAYGYAAGTAIVSYSYYEDYDRAGPIQPSVNWQFALNRRDHHTKMYTNSGLENTLLLRRDGEAMFLVDCPIKEGIKKENITVGISGWVGSGYRFSGVTPSLSAKDTATNAVYPKDKYEVTKMQDGESRVKVRVAFAADAPVGYYRISVQAQVLQSKEVVTYSLHTPLIVLFNPYGNHDDVKQSKANRQEYVEGTEGLIWQGLSDDNTAHTWAFDQFKTQQLLVSLDSLRRMPVKERGDAALVSRHLTYALNEDICYGKWGSGSYTTGKPDGGYKCSKSNKARRCYEPGHWTGTAELFAAHVLNNGNRVQYCQCFVYAGVLTTIGRSLGIATRPVTTFQSAHDTTKDRSINKFYDVDSKTGIFTPATAELPDDSGHDSIWSFHVWNEMYMKRPLLNAQLACKTCANGWQTLDATPQEFSQGGDSGLPTEPAYMLGPAAVRGVVKKNLDPKCRSQSGAYGCFDSQFVISEVNSNILMWTRNSGATGGKDAWKLYPEGCGSITECGFPTDPFGDPFGTIGLQISTKKRGRISDECRRSLKAEKPRDCSKELDDITSSYKKSEPSGPGAPTLVKSSEGARMLRATWSHTSFSGITTTFHNHTCGNPYDGGSYEWHSNDWCEIVPGSCDAGTFDGLPGDEDVFLDGGAWWDNCGSGKVNENTGALIPLKSWTSDDITMLEGMDISNMTAMIVVSRKAIPTTPAPVPKPTLATSPSSNDKKELIADSSEMVTSGSSQEQKGITPSEQKELRRVFDHLANYSKKRKLYATLNPLLDRRQKLVQAKKSSFEIQVQDAEGNLMSEAQIDEETNKLTAQIEVLQKQIGEYDLKVSPKDLRTALTALGKSCTKREIADMIWEVDENLDGCVDWEEFTTMFERNIMDTSGLEPFQLFNVVQFMMYDKDNSGNVTVDETMHMLYARYGKQHLESQMKALFGEDLKTADGDGELSFEEYLKAVSIRLPKSKSKGKKKGKK
eukprot:g5337.t1